MHVIHALRTGIPDGNFFGNTFVALSLASQIPNSVVLANPNALSKKDQQEWARVLESNRGITLTHGTQMSRGSDLETLVRSKISTAEGPVIIDYHYPETSIKSDGIRAIPDEFGTDVRQVVHLHCSGEFFFRNRKRAKERKRNLVELLETGKVQKYVPVSFTVRDSYLDTLPAESMEVSQNGIAENIYPFRPEADKDAFRRQFNLNGKFTIGYAGRLELIKGYDNLLQVMAWFGKHPEFDVCFALATSGGQRLAQFAGDLETRAPRLLAEQRVGLILDVAKFTGGRKLLNHAAYEYFENMVEELRETSPLYQGISPVPLQAISDVYIQPSESEGLPLSTIEAVFTGTPVVAYRVGGIPEVIGNAEGALVDYHRSLKRRGEDFAQAIVHMIDREYGPIGEKDSSGFRRELRDRAVPVFGEKAMARRMVEIYDSL